MKKIILSILLLLSVISLRAQTTPFSTWVNSLPAASNLNSGYIPLVIGNGSTQKAPVSLFGPSTVGSSILYGNGTGGFSNVTIGANITFSGGVLSATGGSTTLGTFFLRGNGSGGFTNLVTPTTGQLIMSAAGPDFANSGVTSDGTNITGGIWHGTPIADAYIASATNWNTAYTDRWSRASGAILTGVNTITSNSPNQLLFNGTWTASANNQNHVEWGGYITARAIASDVLNYMVVDPTLTAGANTQTLNALKINATFVPGAFTGLVKNIVDLQVGGADVLTVSDVGNITTSNMRISNTNNYIALHPYGSGIAYNSAAFSLDVGQIASGAGGGFKVRFIDNGTSILYASFSQYGSWINPTLAINSTSLLSTFYVLQGVYTGGTSFPISRFDGGAHTGQTAEIIDNYFNSARALGYGTAGTIPLQRFNYFAAPTAITATGTTSLTIGATVYIDGAVTGGTNITVPTSAGLYVASNAISNVTNGYGAYFNAPSGATNNYAAGFAGGKTIFAPSTTGYSSITIQSGVTPTSPSYGDVWLDASNVFQFGSTGLSIGYGQGAGTRSIIATGISSNYDLTLQSKGQGGFILSTTSANASVITIGGLSTGLFLSGNGATIGFSTSPITSAASWVTLGNTGLNANIGVGGSGGILGIIGTATNNNAQAGNVGEEIISNLSTYTNYTTTATYQNIASIALTAGDWDITCSGTLSGNSSTLTTTANAIFVVSTTTASAAGSVEGQNILYLDQNIVGASKQSITIGPYRVSIASSTTYYLNTQATFTVGNPQFVGFIRARRIR